MNTNTAQPKLFELYSKCPVCYWPLQDSLCRECGYMLDLGYHVRMKPGRCANGAELGSGTLWHAVLPDNYKAVCGTEPGRRTPGWSSWHNSKEVTCPKCLKKLDAKG